MTTATTDKTKTVMATLDKWWSVTTEEEADVEMDEGKDKERGLETKYSTQPTQNSNKQESTTTTVHEKLPMMLRFKINSSSKEEANEKHNKILQTIAVEMKKCEIFTTKGERTNLKPNNIDEFQYHETKTR